MAALSVVEVSTSAVPRPAAPADKCLFWIAATTPCDKNLKFEDACTRTCLHSSKRTGLTNCGAGVDGRVPVFFRAERKKVAETALKHKNGLNIIICSGTSNFPETIELSQHAAANGADGLLIIPPFYYKQPPLEGLQILLTDLRASIHSINLYHYPRMSEVPSRLRCCTAWKNIPIWQESRTPMGRSGI